MTHEAATADAAEMVASVGLSGDAAEMVVSVGLSDCRRRPQPIPHPSLWEGLYWQVAQVGISSKQVWGCSCDKTEGLALNDDLTKFSKWSR